ncbi:MAG: 2-hydroxychromene-2-carboxylate isomerase [Rhodobacteraceae bacterium]|nr:2-hydroxychromene-2-carboxylate isomerase [Paracoccaceae bacterium]
MARIEYFVSLLSPYCYLAGDGLERIAQARGAEVVWRPFDIAQVYARTGGTPLPQRHESRQAYRLADLRRSAAMAGMPITLRPRHWPTNPAPASFAVIAAQGAGGGDTGALVRGLLAACWAQERDIAEDAVIADCLEAAGFDRALAGAGMLAGAEAYGRNTEEAIRRGVFGTPSYLVGEELFWGHDRLSHLEAHLAGRI